MNGLAVRRFCCGMAGTTPSNLHLTLYFYSDYFYACNNIINYQLRHILRGNYNHFNLNLELEGKVKTLSLRLQYAMAP